MDPNRPPPPLVLVPKSEGHRDKSFIKLRVLVSVLKRSLQSDAELQKHLKSLTSKRGGLVGSKRIVLLREKTTAGARPSVSKQAGRGAAGCTETKAGAGGGGGRLAESTGPKQTAWREEPGTKV